MTAGFRNSGIVNQGGSMTVSGTAVGDGATVVHRSPAGAAEGGRAEIGVITIKPVEARAVMGVLGLKREIGTPYAYGMVEVQGVVVKVAMICALEQGQQSTMAAFENLKERFRPAVVALVGIGGGFHPDVSAGDVAIGTRAVHYDRRKETADGIQRRGHDRSAPAVMGNAVNSFFIDHGEPARFEGEGGAPAGFDVVSCVIGTGDAVIADAESEIRRYLRQYNDKISVVDMEAGGLAQAFHERGGSSRMHGWVVIRGVSDHSDREKNDVLQETAARRAAEVLRALIPYLPSRT